MSVGRICKIRSTREDAWGKRVVVEKNPRTTKDEKSRRV
jgi:hypothetical protein